MVRIFLLIAISAIYSPLHAQTSTSSPPRSPSLEQRVADLEAYVNNSARGADVANARTVSNIAGLVTILWWAAGYSLVFSHGSPLLGGLKFAFLRGVDAHPNGDYSYWVSQNVFAMYQLMFAIITPALIIGAVAER